MSTSEPIVIEQVFDVSPADLWKAITDHQQMVQWFFDNIPDFQPEAGFKTHFHVQSGNRDFKHLWTITEADPPRRIVYDWRYEDLPGVGKVTFEVLDHEAGSMLRVSNEGLETFPADIPEFSRESCVGGWEYFIQGNLKNYLESIGQ